MHRESAQKLNTEANPETELHLKGLSYRLCYTRKTKETKTVLQDILRQTGTAGTKRRQNTLGRRGNPTQVSHFRVGQVSQEWETWAWNELSHSVWWDVTMGKKGCFLSPIDWRLRIQSPYSPIIYWHCNYYLLMFLDQPIPSLLCHFPHRKLCSVSVSDAPVSMQTQCKHTCVNIRCSQQLLHPV